MRRFSILDSVVVLLALSALGLTATRTVAQEATPTAALSIIELAPGVTAEIFAGAPSARASSQTIYLARFVFQPGAAIFPHSHPGTTILGVDSGTFGWTLRQGTAHVVRGAGDEPAVAYGTLVLTSGAPLLMLAGLAMGTPTMATPAP